MVMSRVCCCCCRRRVFNGEGLRRDRPSAADGTRRRQRDGSKAKLAKFFGIFYSMDDELEEDNNRKGQPEPIGKEDVETEPMIWRRRGEEAAAASSQMRQQKELADSATVPSTVSSSKCVMEAKGQHRFALKFEDTEYIVDVNSRGAAEREAEEGAVQQQNFRLYRRSHSLAGKVPPPALPNLLSSSPAPQIRPKMSVVGRVASLFVSDDSSAASSTAGGEGSTGGGTGGGGGTRRKRPSLLGMIGVGGQRGSRSVSAFIPALFQRQKSSGETDTVAESDAPGEEERQRRMVGDAVEK
uniref:Uncharacterized protein n=1 Tax=Globodera rostochiensis TaxID=31243 RepID=A0A914HB94_GLORO